MKKLIPILLVFIILSSCNLFDLREAETPAKPPSWNSYMTSWDLCLQNLEYCYEDSRNAVKYISLFTEDFNFRFAAQDVNDYNFPISWNAQQEQDMLLNLFAWTDSVQVNLQEIVSQPDDITATEAKIYRKYELIRYPSDKSIPQQYQGELELHFMKSGAYWYIRKWFDYRVASNPTWGKLKYDFSQ